MTFDDDADIDNDPPFRRIYINLGRLLNVTGMILTKPSGNTANNKRL